MWQFAPSEQHRTVTLDNGVSFDVLRMSELIKAKNDLIKGRKEALKYKQVAWFQSTINLKWTQQNN